MLQISRLLRTKLGIVLPENTNSNNLVPRLHTALRTKQAVNARRNLVKLGIEGVGGDSKLIIQAILEVMASPQGTPQQIQALSRLAGDPEALQNILTQLSTSQTQLGLYRWHPEKVDLARRLKDPKEWQPYQPKRGKYAGQTIYKNKRTGAVRESMPDQSQQQPPQVKPAKQPRVKAEKPTVENMSARGQELLKGNASPEDVVKFADDVMKLKKPEMIQVAKSLGAEGKGTKAQLAIKMAAKAMEMVKTQSPAKIPSTGVGNVKTEPTIPAGVGEKPQAQEVREMKTAAKKPTPTQPQSKAKPDTSSAAGGSKPSKKETLSTLKNVYDELGLLTRYQSGFIELPEMYDKAKEQLPDLSVKEFHDLLLELEKQRKVELHTLNEVAKADQPDKAIWRDGTAAYYVLWQ